MTVPVHQKTRMRPLIWNKHPSARKAMITHCESVWNISGLSEGFPTIKCAAFRKLKILSHRSYSRIAVIFQRWWRRVFCRIIKSMSKILFKSFIHTHTHTRARARTHTHIYIYIYINVNRLYFLRHNSI